MEVVFTLFLDNLYFANMSLRVEEGVKPFLSSCIFYQKVIIHE